MYILGICNDETASACLLKNGEILAAASEERFTRVKQDNSFPIKSINYVLKHANINLEDVEIVSYSWFKGFDKSLLIRDLERYKNIREVEKSIIIERIEWEIKRDEKKRKEFDEWVKKNKKNKKFVVKDYYHHTAHAASASFYSEFKDGIVLTSDARGDFESLTISRFDRSRSVSLQKIYSATSSDSLGFFYGRITGLLGYEPMKHEGKITGLAAFGNYKKSLNMMKKMIDYKNGEIKANLGDFYKPFFRPYSAKLKKIIKSQTKEDIAAGAQKHLENCLIKILNFYLKKYKIKNTNLMLAGGVFGNVKINQVLKEMKQINKLFVQPQMGDGGLCLGAAALSANEQNIKVKPMLTAYLGPTPTKIISFKGKFRKKKILENLTSRICQDLKDSKVVGLIRGRMEFGPRALCNRSIIYKTSDKTINKWLNERLSRTEFMPFAPVIRSETANKYLLKVDIKDITFRFMTSTVKCSKEFQNKCPAVTHIDGTARPQIVEKKENEFMWQLLKMWEKESGEFSLVNTSFNAHEEPIICDYKEALDALDKRIVDVLYIENFRFVRIV